MNSATHSISAPNTLAPVIGASFIHQAAMVLFGSWALTLMSQLEIPGVVPITLQTLGVLLIGLTFGARLAFLTLAAYLIQGAMGLPVFAGGGAGIAKLAGPTGGYLIGFLFAATIIGWLADKGLTRSWVGTVVALVAGTIVIYAFGLPWLGSIIGYDKALEFGLYPFITGDAIKLVLAALLGRGVLTGAERLARL
jgi:biotin transport system substrate-specific component